MAVIGAVLGDIAGSQYEFARPYYFDWKTCDIFTPQCYATDDTIMTLAAKKAVLERKSFASAYREVGALYPDAGYGNLFAVWLANEDMDAYSSFGNGSAMRCSYIGEHFKTENEVITWAIKSAECTHNHPEGIKGAVVTAMCTYMARTGATKKDIYKYVKKQYPKKSYKYGIEKSIASYRDIYKWDTTCQGSVPVAIRCFLESDNYETFLRNVFSLPCDMDTLCAIGGGIAEEFYHGTGFDNESILQEYLDSYLFNIVKLKEDICT